MLCALLIFGLAPPEAAAQVSPSPIAPESGALLDAPPDASDRESLAEEPPSPQGQRAAQEAPAAAASVAASAEASALFKPLLWLMRLLTYAGLFFGLGGAVFGALAPPLPRRAGQICQDLMLAALIALPVSVSLEGLAVLGRPWNDALFPDVLRAGLAASGAWVLMSAAALAFGLAALGWRSLRPFLAAAGLLTASVAFAASGMAAGLWPQGLTRLAAFLHAAGLTLGVGALIPLAFHLRRRTEGSAALLTRCLEWFPAVAVATAVSGFVLAAARLGRPGASWLKPSGALLVGEALLLLSLAGFALWGRLRWSKPVLTRTLFGRRKLRDMLETATILTLGALALAAAWRFAAPASTPAAGPKAAESFALGLLAGPEARAEVLATPERAGLLRLDLNLQAPDSGPLEAEAMRVGVFLPGSGMEPVFYEAARGENGIWRVQDASLPRPGLWRVEAEARLTAPRTARLEGDLEIER